MLRPPGVRRCTGPAALWFSAVPNGDGTLKHVSLERQCRPAELRGPSQAPGQGFSGLPTGPMGRQGVLGRRRVDSGRTGGQERDTSPPFSVRFGLSVIPAAFISKMVYTTRFATTPGRHAPRKPGTTSPSTAGEPPSRRQQGPSGSLSSGCLADACREAHPSLRRAPPVPTPGLAAVLSRGHVTAASSPWLAERLRFDLFILKASVTKSGALLGGWVQARSKVRSEVRAGVRLPGLNVHGFNETGVSRHNRRPCL